MGLMAMSNQMTASGKAEWRKEGRRGHNDAAWRWACHHLHSTATVFWAGEAEDGLMAVSEDPEELVEAVVWDTEEEHTHKRKHVGSKRQLVLLACHATGRKSCSYLLALSSSVASCAGQWTPPLTLGSGSTS